MKRLPVLVAPALLCIGFAPDIALAQSSCVVGQFSVPFSFTGAQQSMVVPGGYGSADIFLRGAQGGVSVGPSQGAGGLGAEVSGPRAVAAGETLYVYVGGQGSVFNGGGLSGGGNAGLGGGASDVRAGGTALGNRIAVAGGGGGGGSRGCESAGFGVGGNGGVGGGGIGGDGGDSPTSGGVAGGGRGGNFGSVQGAFGGAGAGCGGFLGQNGGGTVLTTGGAGGAGQACCCFGSPRNPDGGGGGGGAVGGGGGGGGSAGTTGCSGNDKGAGGGGGGGSSSAPGLIFSNMTNGVQLGNGSVEICLNLGNTAALTSHVIAVNGTVRDSLSTTRTEVWHRARLFAGRSYQISAWPVDHEQGVDAASLATAVFSDDSGTVPAAGVTGGTAALEGTPNQGGDDKPVTAIIQPTATGVYKIRTQLVGLTGFTPHSVNVTLRETTLSASWTSRGAGFEGFIEMHNNTSAAVSVTLRAYDSAGVLQGAGVTFSLPANATAFRTATQVGVPVNIFAGIVATHDGAAGAISGNITTLNPANGLSFDSPFSPRDPGPMAKPVR